MNRIISGANFLRVPVYAIFAGILLTGGCSKGNSKELTISAAISLKDAFEAIGAEYKKKYRGISLYFNFSSSGTLQKQISAGAPVDLFASASQKFMDKLEAEGKLLPGTRKNFARNHIVLIIPDTPAVPVKTVKDLLNPGIKKIAIGNPETVPAGAYAYQSLVSLAFIDTVKERLIYAEHVRQVLDYVITAEVDAGLVYRTDAFIADRKISIATTLDDNLHQPVIYPIAVIRGTRQEDYARHFIEMVISAKGNELLKRYGYNLI